MKIFETIEHNISDEDYKRLHEELKELYWEYISNISASKEISYYALLNAIKK